MSDHFARVAVIVLSSGRVNTCTGRMRQPHKLHHSIIQGMVLW